MHQMELNVILKINVLIEWVREERRIEEREERRIEEKEKEKETNKRMHQMELNVTKKKKKGIERKK